MIDLVAKEMKRIMADRRVVLGSKICSISLDFWTDGSRRQCFGCIIADLQAYQYEMSNGLTLFMSNHTQARLMKRDDDIFVTGVGALADLEYPLNFERFEASKTSSNVSDWIQESTDAVGMKSEDINVLSADGASSAIGSIVNFEADTRNERAGDQEFEICAAHQNQRSASYASGTGDFVENANPELAAVLNKNHKTQVRHSTLEQCVLYALYHISVPTFIVFYR